MKVSMLEYFSQKNMLAVLFFMLISALAMFSIVELTPNLSDVTVKTIFLVVMIGCYAFSCSCLSVFEKQIVGLFLLYVFGLIAIAASHEFIILFSFRVEMYWHALLLLTLFIAFKKIELSVSFYWNVLTVIAILIFGVAVYAFIQDISRANGVAANINSYGKLAGITVVFFAIKLTVYRYDHPTKMIVDLVLMLIAGFGLYISETRAAWIAVFLTLIVMTPFLFHSISFKKLGAFVIACVAAITVISLTNSEVLSRLMQGWNDIQQYYYGNIHTSWGYRLEMWRIVLLGFVEHPVWGHGLDAFNAYTVALKEAGLTQLPDNFGSPHNEYMHMLFSVGIVGLLLFLSLLIGLLVLLVHTIGGIKNIHKSLYARLYFSLVVYIAITCLFDTSWSNKHVLYVYVVMLVGSAVMLQKDYKVEEC